MLAVVTLPLPARGQGVLALGVIVVFLAADRLPGRAVSLVLAALSAAVSLRYIFWRLTDTLDLPGWPQWGLGVGLATAELYAVAALLLGYLQSAWPLRRKPLPLPADPRDWPAVDVFIPTLNEPAALVRATVLAAIGMDWPADRLAVWLLDDGARPELRAFAAACRCSYLTRPDRHGAKAGNLNHALRHSAAAFVAVFDCDHAPTRAFLQLTLGWLAARPNLAFVQTPQIYRSPDPFRRNLAGAARAAPEIRLFHGPVQDGNDTFNAAMFAGSGAVLRRAALEDVGGFSTMSLTEDAHTSLRLHRRRWDSAFLDLPLAAGLAPETLSGHLRQRRRWARGMLQILRRDNPLLGPGLSLMQRLCYAQSAGHFLFALPRLALLTAPLAFLWLGWSVIAAAPLALVAYAGPHLALAVGVSARLNGRARAAFWGGLYETVLAVRLIPVTLATLLRPRRGRFAVTPKGDAPVRAFFDWRAVLPNLLLAALLIAGLAHAAYAFAPTPALWLNAAWAAAALALLLTAAAAGRERPGHQEDAAADLPATLTMAGRAVAGRVTSLSREGAALRLDPGGPAAAGDAAVVEIMLGGEAVALSARLLGVKGGDVRVAWTPADLIEEARVVRVALGRADAWTAAPPRQSVIASLWRLLAAAPRGLFRRRATLALGAAMLLAAHAAMGQDAPGSSDLSIRAVPGAPAETFAAPAPPPRASPPTSSPPSLPPAPAAAAPAPGPGSRTVVYTLHQLGASGPLSLRGTAPLQGVRFGIRADEVVTAATLNLDGAVSPALLPDLSNVTVTLNDQYLATIPADRQTPGFTADVPINPALFQGADDLQFRLSGRVQADCDDPLSGLLWATIADSSTMTLTLQRLPPLRDLARLPLPFLDAADPDAAVVPFVLPQAPDNQALRAAGIAAAWFGEHAALRGARFPAAAALPASGNAVLVSVGEAVPGLPGAPPIAGPTLAVLPNPRDKLASVLLIAGRTGQEAVAAATALAFASRALTGASAAVQAPEVLPRQPYDAPAWIASDHPVRLGALAGRSALQGSGYVSLLHVKFRAAPDLWTWRDRPFALHLRWRAPPGPVEDAAASRFDVGLDGAYLASLPLALDGQPVADAVVGVPAADVSGADDLQLYFDARPLRRAACDAIPGDLRMAVDPDSTLDLSRGHHIALLPNLAYFADAGFPFTRLADLSQTAIVLPDQPSEAEIGAFLDLMGRFGAQTGLPGARAAVVRPGEVARVADRDLLLVGTVAGLRAPGMGSLLDASPVGLADGRLHLRLSAPLDPWRRVFGDPAGLERSRASVALSAAETGGFAVLAGAPSPLRAGRSVVALLGGDGAALDAALRSLRDPDQARLVQGDLAIISGGQVTAYRVGPTYTVGSLPFWLWPSWYLRGRPLGALAVLAGGCVLLGLALFFSLRRRAADRLPPRRRAD